MSRNLEVVTASRRCPPQANPACLTACCAACSVRCLLGHSTLVSTVSTVFFDGALPLLPALPRRHFPFLQHLNGQLHTRGRWQKSLCSRLQGMLLTPACICTCWKPVLRQVACVTCPPFKTGESPSRPVQWWPCDPRHPVDASPVTPPWHPGHLPAWQMLPCQDSAWHQ